MNLRTKITKNFTLYELLRSSTAERNPEMKAQQQNPSEDVLKKLRYLAQTTLQPIREKFGCPIILTSGYRSPLLNTAVKGSTTSQHVVGEAADCKLSESFMEDERTATARAEVAKGVKKITGSDLRDDVTPEFYLFAFICLNLDELDVDQVIHEYGEGLGQPAWVHVSASERQNKRQILAMGSYGRKSYELKEALGLGT